MKEGGLVVVRDASGVSKVLPLPKDGPVRVHKTAVDAATVLGCPLGSSFRSETGADMKRYRRVDQVLLAHEENPETMPQETNALLNAKNENQTLTEFEIVALKKETSGTDLVAQLAAASSTFEGKTKYSQEKYLAKKRKKHLQQLTFLEASTYEVCESYLANSAGRIANMRFDYLAALMSYGNVQAGHHVCVWDGAGGLVAGAAARRGAVVTRLFEKSMSRNVGEQVAGSQEALDRIGFLSLQSLVPENPLESEEFAPPRPARTGEDADPEFEAKRVAKQTAAWEKRVAVYKRLTEQKVDSILVAVGIDEEFPVEFLKHAVKHLKPSGTISIFTTNMSELAELQFAIRYHTACEGTPLEGHNFTHVRLEEFLLREQQVLPNRTHPMMQAEIRLVNGFLLSAIKVLARPQGGNAAKSAKKA